MKLYIVRHGQSLGNVANIIDDNSHPETDKNGLSKKGKQQAEEIVKNLKNFKIDIVITSPLLRTKETVELYLKNNKVKLVISDLTIERNAGIFVGKEKTAIKEYCIKNNIKDRVSFRPEKGESILDVYERSRKFLEYLLKNFKNKSVLLCGHVNFLGCLDVTINKKSIMKFYSYSYLKNGEIKSYDL